MRRQWCTLVGLVLLVLAVTLPVHGIASLAMVYSNEPFDSHSLATTSFHNRLQPALASEVPPEPHPILSDAQVRRAIAYCTDKDALIAAAYPTLTPEQRQELVMDIFVPRTHWAYSTPAATYPYSPTVGISLLEDSGWTLPPGGDIRTKNGKQLVLTLTTTDADFRIAFLTVFEAQMRVCGIRVIRNHQSPYWWFGSVTGLQVRDFELGDYTLSTSFDEPGGYSLYGCDQIPLPTNDWSGWNYMGWCNQAASDAILQASDTGLSQAQRKVHYATFFDLFAQDMPSLILFMRPESTGDYYGWEHIDFNLQTFMQATDVTSDTETVLNYTDYGGNQGTITVPAGAVAESITLGYTPLVANANPPLGGQETAKAFRVTASLGGVPQDTFSFLQPITVEVKYSAADIYDIFDENSLSLYYWDGDSWQEAYMACSEPDRYSRLDAIQDLLLVHVCHLSEFALMGTEKHRVYLPLIMR